MKSYTLRQLITCSLLTGMEIVLSRFLSISTLTVKIGFGFVPIAVCAALYGPVASCICAALGDFLGAVLFPIGPYFPGFTLTAALTGLVLGLFLHTKDGRTPRFFTRVVPAAAINCFILSYVLSSVWLHILYGTEYSALFALRTPQSVLLFAAYLAIIPLILSVVSRIKPHQEYTEQSSHTPSNKDATEYYDDNSPEL